MSPLRNRRTGRGQALAGVGVLLAGLGTAALSTSPAAAAEPVLAEGEQASSDNLQLVANLPKNGAFAGVGAFNSDLAFKGDYLFAGNYNGFTVYDVSKPEAPVQVTQLVCPGSQNDISVIGDLLVLSVDSRRTDDSCTSQAATAQQSKDGAYWEGLRIFDIRDPKEPVYIKAVETDCGSHTHTVAGERAGRAYVYVSSYFPDPSIAKCLPPHDKISVVEIPLKAPTAARVVSEPVLFPGGGNPAGNYSRETTGCHDITAYPDKGIAAGACMGDGVILDIKNPLKPRVVETVRDTENFAFWHSATFNNKADKVVFTDELGGGGAATCNPTVGPLKGANAIFTLEDGRLERESYYKISREQAATENCVAHNGNLIPVEGKDVMVQAWYQGGISVFDFTDAAQPTEIAWFDRGTLTPPPVTNPPTNPTIGGSWSAYYRNGYIYSNDIQQGLDVLELTDDRVAGAESARTSDVLNVQSQTKYKN